MEFKLLNDSIIGYQDENNNWIYKANPEYKVPFKKDGTLKQKYKDFPRFNVIIEAEEEINKKYNSLLKDSVKEMAEILNSFGN